jgi:succinoglycan biosynthesis protein ExoM
LESKVSQITVCICTYKRPELLINLLDHLQNQITDNLFTYSILIVDNDINCSAKKSVDDYKTKSRILIEYMNEPKNGISYARNAAVENGGGEYLAFIDDDEYPVKNWLLYLIKTMNEYHADAVLGPVKPHFEKTPPKWVLKSRLFERPLAKTGTILGWNDTRSGNILIKKRIFMNDKNRFDPLFGKTGGEDKELFYRLINQGFVFVWCNEADAYETVPQERWVISFLLKRALMRGRASTNYPGFNWTFILKSVIALFIYSVIMPFCLIIGFHVFIKYLIKYCDHLGRIFAVMGFNVFSKRSYYFEKGEEKNER